MIDRRIASPASLAPTINVGTLSTAIRSVQVRSSIIRTTARTPPSVTTVDAPVEQVDASGNGVIGPKEEVDQDDGERADGDRLDQNHEVVEGDEAPPAAMKRNQPKTASLIRTTQATVAEK